MKKLLLAVMTVCAVFLLNSCEEEDACKDVDCGDHGGCVSGICDCDAGYEGTLCDVISRTKFLKTAKQVTEVTNLCNAGTIDTFQYFVDVIVGDSIYEVKIKNLGNYNCTSGDYYVTATVDVNDITIPSQTVCSTVFQGDGSILNGTISIDYSAAYTGCTDYSDIIIP